MNEETKKLALRVFKRSNKYLVLLWRKLDGVDPLKTEISFKSLDTQETTYRTPNIAVII